MPIIRTRPAARTAACLLLALAALLPAAPAAAELLLAARETEALPRGGQLRALPADPLVRRVQESLRSAGHYLGPVDGRMNRQTVAAIRAYQRSTGLKVDGRVTWNLAETLKTVAQARGLLRRMDRVRRKNIEKARQALLNQPVTRDLLAGGGGRDGIADPTRDTSPCFRAPTPRCLLLEASESAKAVFRREMRDWALGEILVAQTKAGLTTLAMDTVRRISDPRLIMVALRDIATAQAEAGYDAEALAAAAIIPDALKQAEALAAIATIQANAERPARAVETAGRLIAALGAVEVPLKRVAFRARAAVILGRAGNAEAALDSLAAAEAMARSPRDRDEKAQGLRHVAAALAEMERPDDALRVLRDAGDAGDRTPVLVAAATAQARNGQAAAALSTAEAIEVVRYRAVVLGRVAIAQAGNGAPDAARATLARALAATGNIQLPYARAYAVSRIALAELEIAAAEADPGFAPAVEMAERVGDEKLRAQVLWSIAAKRRRAGDRAGAADTEFLAQAASDAIKSSLSRVWLFADMALARARTGESGAAWTAFARALAITGKIRNSWERSRALGKLAATLVDLRSTGPP